MDLVAFGMNHKTAPIHLREQLAFQAEDAILLIQDLKQSTLINEIVLISTCNRTELYLEAESFLPVFRWLRKKRQLTLDDLKAYTYTLSSRAAVRHLMRVASGLDSMVLGEAEILGQLKSAYQLSSKQGCLGKCLGRLFQNAFSVAKRVRTQTAIGVNSVSIAYIAVRMAERIFSSINARQVLLIGAGDTARLILKHLVSAGVTRILLANRTVARSQLLADELHSHCQIEFLELEMIPKRLPEADIVISSTASPLPIVGKGMAERAIKVRKHRPIFMVDVAVPRDIEPEVQELPDVFLYCIDDLQEMAMENQRTRLCAVGQAEDIIEQEMELFMGWLRAQDSVSTIKAFRANIEEHKNHLLKKAKQQLDTGQSPDDVIEKMAHLMINRLMHEPTIQMREASFRGDKALISSARKLFKLDDS